MNPEFKLRSLFKQVADEYEELKKILQERASDAKATLLSLDVSIKSKTSPEMTYVLCNLYNMVALFPDEEIHAAFKKIGFSESSLKWMVLLSEIDEEIRNIESKGFVIIKRQFLVEILIYLDFQITNVVLLEIGYYVKHDGRIWNSVAKGYYEAFRRIDYAGKLGKSHDDFITVFIREQSKAIQAVWPEAKNRRFFTDILQGKTESRFLPFLMECITDLQSEPKLTAKLNASYNLFRLICKDHILPPQDDIVGTTKASLLKKLLFKR